MELEPKTKPKSDFRAHVYSTLLVPLYIPTHRFPGRFSRACYTIYIYIYIFRWWLDTAESVSPKGQLRLDGVCCDWAFALLCFVVGSVTTGTPAHHPTL